MNRELTEVIDKMLAVGGFPEAFQIVLTDLRSSAAYAPPEGQRLWWDETTELVNDAIPGEPSEEWEKKVVAIFLDKEAE
jgi:hypothetical protein